MERPMISMRRVVAHLTDDQIEELRGMYLTTPLKDLASHFRVGVMRMREILVEHGLTERLYRKDMQERPTVRICGTCKRISTSDTGKASEGWCMKWKRRVSLRSSCSEHRFPFSGTYEMECHQVK